MESITDMLADLPMQALFRVLAFEFFMRNRITEYTHTPEAGAAALAKLERESTAAAATACNARCILVAHEIVSLRPRAHACTLARSHARTP